MVKAIVNLHSTPEDQRIACIGEAAAATELGVDFKKIGRELEAAVKEKAAKKKAPAKASKKAKGAK